jgi:ankyrin repeat protein
MHNLLLSHRMDQVRAEAAKQCLYRDKACSAKCALALTFILLAVVPCSVSADLDGGLWQAVERQDADAVKKLLAQGAKVDCRNAVGRTPLILAAEAGNLEITRVLVDSGADVNGRSQTPTGSTVLSFAVEKGNLKLVEFLLERGAKIDGQGNNGVTPLYYAVANDKLEAARFLLERGADPNKLALRNNLGNLLTPLMAAVIKGNTNMVELLLARGARLEKRNNRGGTVLMEAAKQVPVEIIQLLLARGANVNATGPYGHTALIYSAYNGRTETAKLLLAAGADPLATATDSEDPDEPYGRYGADTLARQQGHRETQAIIVAAQERAKARL